MPYSQTTVALAGETSRKAACAYNYNFAIYSVNFLSPITLIWARYANGLNYRLDGEVAEYCQFFVFRRSFIMVHLFPDLFFYLLRPLGCGINNCKCSSYALTSKPFGCLSLKRVRSNLFSTQV